VRYEVNAVIYSHSEQTCCKISENSKKPFATKVGGRAKEPGRAGRRSEDKQEKEKTKEKEGKQGKSKRKGPSEKEW